jgi:hypothetical protein
VTVERLDTDPECDGLAPASIPDPVSARLENPGGRCGGAVSDGTGHVAVAIAPSLPWQEAQVLSPAGAPLARFRVWGEVAPQPDGWLIALGSYGHGPGTVSIVSLYPDGSERGGQSFGGVNGSMGGPSWELGAAPRGGCFVVVHAFRFSATDPCSSTGHWVDTAGSLVGGAVDLACGVRAAGVSTRGEALALERRPDAAGGFRSYLHWIRRDGTDAMPPADEGSSDAIPPTVIDLFALLDGSLAARSDGAWFRRYPYLAAAGEPAPAWLAARGRETFRFTRGNRGYAFFPVPGQAAADCRQAFELVAPSGRSCVRITLREDATGCTTRVVDQGPDGTIVQQSGKDPCAYRWWPELLGG